MSPFEFRELVALFCTRFGASVTSYYRTPAHNATLPGSVLHSAHLFWLGVDVVYDTPQSHEERVETATRLGLLLIVEGDHDHLQPATWIMG